MHRQILGIHPNRHTYAIILGLTEITTAGRSLLVTDRSKLLLHIVFAFFFEPEQIDGGTQPNAACGLNDYISKSYCWLIICMLQQRLHYRNPMMTWLLTSGHTSTSDYICKTKNTEQRNKWIHVNSVQTKPRCLGFPCAHTLIFPFWTSLLNLVPIFDLYPPFPLPLGSCLVR